MSWATFIKAHLGEIVATDFFTVEILKPFGLVRYYVLFVIDIFKVKISSFSIGYRSRASLLASVFTVFSFGRLKIQDGVALVSNGWHGDNAPGGDGYMAEAWAFVEDAAHYLGVVKCTICGRNGVFRPIGSGLHTISSCLRSIGGYVPAVDESEGLEAER